MYVRSALEKELLASSLTSWQDRRRALLGIDPSRRDSLFKQVISGCAYFDWSKTLLTSTMRDIQSKRPKCGLFAYEMLLPYEPVSYTHLEVPREYERFKAVRPSYFDEQELTARR